MKQLFKKGFRHQNLRKKPLDPYEHREVSQRNLESSLFLLNMHGREKEFRRRPKRDITTIRKG